MNHFSWFCLVPVTRTSRNQNGERGRWRMRRVGAANPSLTVGAPSLAAEFSARFCRSFTTAVIIAFGLLGNVPSAHGARPNIVYMMADDLGIGDVKCYGGDRCQIETPALDSLARDGMMFTDAHAAASVCVPSRMAIMTGRYAWRFQTPRVNGPWGFLNPRIPTDHFTVGNMLQKLGYSTGYIGKWHLGTLMQTTDGKNQGLTNVDYDRPLRIGPGNYGFDYSFILPGSLDMYPYVFCPQRTIRRQCDGSKRLERIQSGRAGRGGFRGLQGARHFRGRGRGVYRAASRPARGRSRLGRRTLLPLLCVDRSAHSNQPESSIRREKQAGALWRLCLGNRPHDGTGAKGTREARANVGNTLVIATSDHGAASYAGNIRKATFNQIRELEKQGHYSSGIYRGYKFTVFEGGLRVPLLVRWPGVVEPGSRCAGLVGLVDLAATVADILDYDLPSGGRA